MRLLTHEHIPPDTQRDLQLAVDLVERCQSALNSAGDAVHLAAKNLPPETERPTEKLAAARWNAMRKKREQQVIFTGIVVRQAENDLTDANQALAAEIEIYRRAASALYDRPYEQRQDNAAYYAAFNVIVCDNLCSAVIAERGYNNWPKSISGKRGLDEFEMRDLFTKNKRKFTYRYKVGDSQWSYNQGRFNYCFMGNCPEADFLTQEEAELGASGFAQSLAGSTRPEFDYVVQTWDIHDGCPGLLSIRGMGQDTRPEGHGVHGVI